jgi:single-strand DNA-binding protein
MYTKTQVIGYLGNDAVLRDFNGKKVLNFSIAHSQNYTNEAGVKVEKTQWFECSMWSSEKVAPYLKKGVAVMVEGSIAAHAFVSKDSEAKASLRLTVFGLTFMPSGQKKSETEAPQAATEPVGINPHDLPF